MVNFGQLGKALNVAKSLAGQHGDKIGAAIDKSVEAVDKATGGKHHEKLADSGAKLKDAAGRLGDQPTADDAVRDRDPDTGAAPAAAQDAPVADPGAAGTAQDAPVADPGAADATDGPTADPGTPKDGS